MTILHIPSWYPNKHSPVAGIFIKNLIEAVASLDTTNQHIVLNWHDTKAYSVKKPFNFIIKNIHAQFDKTSIISENNITYIKFRYFQSGHRIFGDSDKRLMKKISTIINNINSKNKIDLIHAHVTYPAGYIAQHINAKFKIPYLISEQMGPFPFEEYKSNIDRLIISPIKNAKKIVALSTLLSKEIESLTHIKADIIPNVIDETLINTNNTTNNIVENEFKFIIVGYLSRIKGIDILIEAISMVCRTKTNFKVIVIGDGSIADELKQQAQKMGVDKYIQWMGFQYPKEVILQVQASNCFISTSRHESFGVAIAEALACGKPVIATKSGGPEDFINKSNGILVENENVKEVAQAMIWMIDNVQKFDPISIRENFKDQFSASTTAQKYLHIYNEVIQS